VVAVVFSWHYPLVPRGSVLQWICSAVPWLSPMSSWHAKWKFHL